MMLARSSNPRDALFVGACSWYIAQVTGFHELLSRTATTTCYSPSMASSTQYRTFNSAPSTRPGTNSRRTASAYDVRPRDGFIQHPRTPPPPSASSSVLPFNRSYSTFTRSVSPISTTLPVTSDPQFSRLFNTVLGSPFLTTSDPFHLDVDSIDLDTRNANERPPSPTPTADFSIIDMDPEDSEPNPMIPGGYPTKPISSPMASIGLSRGRQAASTSWNGLSNAYQPSPPQQTHSLKSLLPRLWDALSSPGRMMLNGNTISPPSSASSSRTASPSASPRRLPGQSWYASNTSMGGRQSPVYWNTSSGSKAKGKAKAGANLSSRNGNASPREHINYLELPPLDGEEGELIDDEACFIDVRAVTGIGEHLLFLDKVRQLRRKQIFSLCFLQS